MTTMLGGRADKNTDADVDCWLKMGTQSRYRSQLDQTFTTNPNYGEPESQRE